MNNVMTVDQFMMYLELTVRDWELVNNSSVDVLGGPFLRTRVNKDCPVTAVCRLLTGEVYPTTNFTKAAAVLGLDKTEAGRIAGSADLFCHYGDYRSQLLLACGLDVEVPCESVSMNLEPTLC